MYHYKAIIFDLGGVVINVTMDKIFDYWAKETGYNANYIKQIFESEDIFHRFERGEISPTDYKENISRNFGLEINEDKFYNVWNDIFHDLDPRIEDLLDNLKSKFRLVVLTNTNEIHGNKWKNKYQSILKYFEKIFCSYEIHSRKPEKKAYKIVINYLNMEPKFILFLDDRIKNIKVASFLGLKGILVKSTEQMINSLNKLGLI
jgi:epoxide hydrolase-like predicted phosphatase